MQKKNLGFIGGGNMARSLVGGLVNSGYSPDQIIIADPDPQQRRLLSERFGVTVHAENVAAAENADVLVLAVKPQVLKQALTEIKQQIDSRCPLLVSIAAGIRSSDIASWIASDLPIVRVMPNTPALVGAGASGLFANQYTSNEQRDTAESIMRAVGTTVWVDDEALIDTVTALSGSGPAYFFYLMEAMEKAAVEGGLSEDAARLLTIETALGAARLALESDDSPAQLRQAVTSPGGTTEKALGVMQERGFAEIVIAAVKAAKSRSSELADILGNE